MDIALQTYNEQKEPDFKQYFIPVKKGEKAKTKKGIFEVAKHITNKWACLALGDFKRDIFIYRDGVYVLGTNKIKEYTQSILEEIYSIGFFNEILEQIKNRCTRNREEIEYNNIDFINLENGILNLKNNELIPHNPKEFYFFNKMPINYNPEAFCPKIEQFLFEILAPKQVDLIQEVIGFCLYRQYFIKKAIIMTGVKNTGKTTFIRFLMALLGKKNVAGISLQDLGIKTFALADLYNKYANIADDLSPEDVINIGKFKMVTGQSPLTGEYKYGDRFHFINYAKLIFACNKIPAVNDVDDEAYFDRWILVNFDKVITEDKRDPFLIDNIIKEKDEMSGFLNFAIAGLHRLLKNKKFSYDKEPEQIKQEMLQNSNPIASFVYNCLIKTNNENFNYINKSEMYNYYCEFCGHKNLGIETVDKFSKDILIYAPYLRDYRPGGDTGRPWCWKNVKIILNNI